MFFNVFTCSCVLLKVIYKQKENCLLLRVYDLRIRIVLRMLRGIQSQTDAVGPAISHSLLSPLKQIGLILPILGAGLHSLGIEQEHLHKNVQYATANLYKM